MHRPELEIQIFGFSPELGQSPMLSMLQTLTRSTTNAVASCSYAGTTRYLHSKLGHKGLRGRNWQIAAAYPAPTPLMRKDATDDDEPINLSEEEEPIIPRKPQTKLKNSKRALPDEWKRHRSALKEYFPDGWSPPKKLSRTAMEGLRIMYNQNPEVFTTPILASKFRISPEAVRRILKSKWEPTRERRQKLAERERMEGQERLRKAQLEETKSRIEAIMDKKHADEEESALYWSKQAPEKRIEAEKQSNRGHRPGFGRQGRSFGGGRPRLDEERPQRPARSKIPKGDLFFS
jgi:hypothetical protein